MLAAVYLSFAALLVACGLLELLPSSQATPPANPAFRRYQRLFLAAYLPALWADWLQGPYLYKLYQHYHFLESQIAVLYVCGLASRVLLAPPAAWLLRALGRRPACLLFCLTYCACCATKLSRDYLLLALGRVLGGVSTALLTTAFEAWYVHGHLRRHDFPPEWIGATFSEAERWNHGLAVGAGLVANLLAEGLGLGPVAPFLLAVPVLAACGWVVLRGWGGDEALVPSPPPEPGPARPHASAAALFWRSGVEGLRCLLGDGRVMLLGAVQALFESVLYIFVFLWTPVMDPHAPPLGILFSCLMAASMIGSALFRLAARSPLRPRPGLLLVLSVLLALCSCCALSVSTAAGRAWPGVSLLACLLLEGGCGLYFPSVGVLQGRVIPERRRAAVLAWFRVPLHLLACAGLLALHGEGASEGGGATGSMFAACAGMMLAALIAALTLFALNTDQETDKCEGGGVQ